MNIYCIVNSNNQIITLFGGPQNPPTPTGYTEMADNDSRYTSYVAAQNLIATSNAQYQAAINGGIVLTSTGTPALNGTYSVTTTAQHNISGVMSGIANGLGLPGGGSTFQYQDMSGKLHAWSATAFPELARAVRDFVYNCDVTLTTIQAGGVATFPSNQVTIA
ncbi:hypothetical protein [Ferrovum sp.]|uniref:DUF4376 domain-containing protein n=1 Tax=Ferrovum sp. TaxID=2609467 RepID=UPI002635BE7A|nr:hypothetical protein [Ferrovum sp.]